MIYLILFLLCCFAALELLVIVGLIMLYQKTKQEKDLFYFGWKKLEQTKDKGLNQ